MFCAREEKLQLICLPSPDLQTTFSIRWIIDFLCKVRNNA